MCVMHCKCEKILILWDLQFFPNYDPFYFTIAKWQIPVSSWERRLFPLCFTIAFFVLEVIFWFSKVKYVSKSLTYGMVIYPFIDRDCFNTKCILVTACYGIWGFQHLLPYVYLQPFYHLIYYIQRFLTSTCLCTFPWLSTYVSILFLLTRQLCLKG